MGNFGSAVPRFRRFILAALLLAGGAAHGQTLHGVNLAGAAFSPTKLPGIYGQDFVYPNAAELAYFTAKGMNVFRISVLWERLQPVLNGPLDPAELARLQSFVAAANRDGASVIIDLHNYGRYGGVMIGQGAVTDAAFADLWGKLARQFGGNGQVLFGLMNEPQLAQAADWQAAAQQAINAIRAAGAGNQILVAGIAWDSATGFASVSGPTLGGLSDPRGRLVFEVHEYFDGDSSGTSDACIDPAQAVDRLAAFTQWLRANKQHGFLGEFAVSRRPECAAVLRQVLADLHDNADVWLGWTFWAAGPAWGEYMFTLEPASGKDRPQMAVLQPYLSPP